MLTKDEESAITAKIVNWLASEAVDVRLTNQSGTQPISTDDITGAFTIIPVVHHEVHEGETFQASYKTPDASPIGDNGTIDVLIQVGAKYPHLVFAGAGGGESEILFWEGTTFSAAGTPLLSNNMKRGGEAATAAVSHTPTVTNAGTLLHNSLIPGGATPQSRSGGALRDDTEWILSLNTDYLVQVQNRAGSAQHMSVVVQWYEESDN